MPAKKTSAKPNHRQLKIDPAVQALLRHFAAALPGVTESLSYGTPAFKVGKTLFCRLHENGETLVLKVDLAQRERLLETEPDRFFLTDHYVNYPYVLVRLAGASPERLRDLLVQSWRLVASKRLLDAYEGQ